jgi:hypothetical protein
MADYKADVANLVSQVKGVQGVDASVRALLRGIILQLQQANQNPSMLQGIVAELQQAEAELAGAVMHGEHAAQHQPSTSPSTQHQPPDFHSGPQVQARHSSGNPPRGDRT